MPALVCLLSNRKSLRLRVLPIFSGVTFFSVDLPYLRCSRSNMSVVDHHLPFSSDSGLRKRSDSISASESMRWNRSFSSISWAISSSFR